MTSSSARTCEPFRGMGSRAASFPAGCGCRPKTRKSPSGVSAPGLFLRPQGFRGRAWGRPSLGVARIADVRRATLFRVKMDQCHRSKPSRRTAPNDSRREPVPR
jgi:hypothetical protein